MIINHNMNAINAHRMMTGNTVKSGKSMEKLSSGLRINRAGDDAAGLAISEKMRAQIKGLEQASRNSQDGISMLQTAEGALNETQSILQRMRELAVQASNDTNVAVDRDQIQKEMNQLTSEINRIGNTTEFNTQKLLKGDGSSDIAKTQITGLTGSLSGGVTTTTNAKQAVNLAGNFSGGTANVSGQTITFSLKGADGNMETLTITVLSGAASGTSGITSTGASVVVPGGATMTSASFTALVDQALEGMIAANSNLNGNYSIGTSGGDLTIESIGALAGTKGAIGTTTVSNAAIGTSAAAVFGSETTTAAQKNLDLSTLASGDLRALAGKGFTIGDKAIEFYNSADGAYTGEAIGVDISSAVAIMENAATVSSGINQLADTLASAINSNSDSFDAAVSGQVLKITADITTYPGSKGNDLSITDGSVKQEFTAKFQIGANKGQSMGIKISDMRSQALGIAGSTSEGSAGVDGAVFTKTSNVTNGTDNVNVEYALDVSSADKASAAIEVINNAIEKVSTERARLGSYQNRLEHTINNLGTAAENLTSAESRIRDVDMAKEMMQFSKNNILSQAAQSMLAQANQQPQGVLQLLR